MPCNRVRSDFWIAQSEIPNQLESNEEALGTFVDSSDAETEPGLYHIQSQDSCEYSDEEDWTPIDIEPKKPEKVDLHLKMNKKRKSMSNSASSNTKLLKKTREYYLACHMLHTDCLIAHSIIRNRWINDAGLQKALKSRIPDNLRKEIKKYHRRVRNGTLANKPHALSLNDILTQLSKVFKALWVTNECSLSITGKDKSEIRKLGMNLSAFKKKVSSFTGSQDIAAQAFVGLLRALRFRTRLICSPPLIDYQSKMSTTLSNLHLFPNYWAEVYDAVQDHYISVDPLVLAKPVYVQERLDRYFQPKGKEAGSMRMYYVFGIDSWDKLINLTPKYMSLEDVPRIVVFGTKNRNKSIAYNHFVRCIQSRASNEISPKESALLDFLSSKAGLPSIFPDKKSYYRGHDCLILKSLLPPFRFLPSQAVPLHSFEADGILETVYDRSDMRVCRTEMAWLKDGREIIDNENAVKIIISLKSNKANKRQLSREKKAKENDSETLRQLFSLDQTRPFVPPKVIDNIIPKTKLHETVLLFKPNMIPDGATHLVYPNIAKVAAAMKIDYAKALVDFKFRKQIAMPVFHGIIVPENSRRELIDEWNRAFREDIERVTQICKLSALKRWKSYHQKLRIIQRLKRYD